MSLRRILISNDDGVNSPFLKRFVEAFSRDFRVSVVVPAVEQSWIGRAYSRHKTLSLKRVNDIASCECFMIDGTPADCVNIALGHIFKGEKFDAVVSGLNIGHNLGMPLLWSSGTFSAAVEGAGWGNEAFAFSLQLKNEYYELCRLKHADAPEELDAVIKNASAHAAQFVAKSCDLKAIESGAVYNVNYPAEYAPHTPFEMSEPARVKFTSLYKTSGDGKFDFKYALANGEAQESLTDMQCLKNGWASCSLIKVF